MLAWSLLRARRGYVGFFRGTPLFVQILLVHFALMPALMQPEGGLLLSGEAARDVPAGARRALSGALALTLNAGAYISRSSAPASRASTAGRRGRVQRRPDPRPGDALRRPAAGASGGWCRRS